MLCGPGQVAAVDTQAADGAVSQMIQTAQQLRQLPEFLQQAFQAVLTANPAQAVRLQQLMSSRGTVGQLQQVSCSPRIKSYRVQACCCSALDGALLSLSLALQSYFWQRVITLEIGK